MYLTVNNVCFSDIFYDDLATLNALHRIRDYLLAFRLPGRRSPVAFISSEIREVFSAAAMQEIRLGYDMFLEMICPHIHYNSSEACWVDERGNRVEDHEHFICGICAPYGKFVARNIEHTTFSQYCAYKRDKYVVLWQLLGICTSA